MEEQIIKACKDASEVFSRIVVDGLISSLSYDIDCSSLGDYDFGQKGGDVRVAHAYQPMFDKLLEIKDSPVLYYFEIKSNTTGDEILDALSKYKNTAHKAVPAVRKSTNKSSKILYVGKVKKAFWGRLVQHLGYYKVQATQGLQLYYWAKPIGLQLKLFVYVFPTDMANYMGIIENHLAMNLQPIIGKHK